MAELSSPDLQIQFEEKCREAEESELYFLFAAFAKMATSRSRFSFQWLLRLLFFCAFEFRFSFCYVTKIRPDLTSEAQKTVVSMLYQYCILLPSFDFK